MELCATLRMRFLGDLSCKEFLPKENNIIGDTFRIGDGINVKFEDYVWDGREWVLLPKFTNEEES